MKKPLLILLLIGLAIGGFALLFLLSEPVVEEEKPFCEKYGTLLMVAAEPQIMAQLKRPQSAELAPIGERFDGLVCEGDSILTWQSYVDAENAFGAQVRTEFTVVGMVYGGQLRVVSVKVGE